MGACWCSLPYIVFEFSDFAIAAQLTYWEADMFRKLHVAEFLDTRWQKKKELAPNLLCLVAHFNKVMGILRWFR